MTTIDPLNERLLKGARALLAFYGQKFQMRFELLTAPPGEVGPEHIVFSPALQERGLWGLEGDRALANENRGELASTFASVLGDAPMPNLEFTQVVERLRSAHEPRGDNVISMTEARRRRRFPVGEVIGPAARRSLKRDCLIESLDVREIHKLAFELHAHGSRRIFIQLSDLDKNVRTCFTSLLNLGPITLFVPEIVALTEDEQRALSTLTEFYHGVRPLVIVGSRLSVAELRASPGIQPDLLKTLTRAHLQLFGAMNRTQDLSPWLDELEREDA